VTRPYSFALSVALCVGLASCGREKPTVQPPGQACTDEECREKYKAKHKEKERAIYVLLQMSGGKCTPFASDHTVRAFPGDRIVWDVENRCGTNPADKDEVKFNFSAAKSTGDPFDVAVKKDEVNRTTTKPINFKIKDAATVGKYRYSIEVTGGGIKDPEIEIEGI
jgi:hypothetical protein